MRRLLAAALLASCACSAEHGASDGGGLLLHGFRLVDPNDHSVREVDLCVEHGVVCDARSDNARLGYLRIEGHGRYLLPAMWDLNLSLWGNNSAKNYDELYQEMSISQCLRVQLFYGVAHVGVFGMDNQWVSREIKRARALGFPAAELLYPDKALGGSEAFACVPIRRSEELVRALDARKARGAPYVQLFYCDPKSKLLPGLSHALLAEALSEATRRGLKGYVLVDTWQRAREAADLGAAIVYGLPEGRLSDDTIAVLLAKGVTYAPALSGALELPRLLGNREGLADPFLLDSVSPRILETFRDPNLLWADWKPNLERGRRDRDAALADLRRLADAGVHLAQVSDTGWTSGTFQGYSAHATQEWLERAGVDPWARLAAATVWPAQSVGRRVGFAPGMPADFVVLDANPLEQAHNLRQLSLVLREGKVIDRAQLAPDLERQKFQP